MPKMKKPMAYYIFRFVQGQWVDNAGDSAILLADLLHELEIEIDEKCEFARFKDYIKNRKICYRAYGGTITVEIWDMQ